MSDILTTYNMTLSEPDQQTVYTVPAGAPIIPTHFVLHSPTGSFSPTDSEISFANSRNEGYGAVPFDFSHEDDQVRLDVPQGVIRKRLVEGDTIIAQFPAAFAGIASIKVDVFGYCLVSE